MSRLVKIVDNKYVQIEEYKNPNICFNTNEYDDFENYCTLRKRFDPFEMFYENQELKKQLEEKNKHQIFIDTQDMEERYAEELYQDFLKEENKKIKKQLEEYKATNKILSHELTKDKVLQQDCLTTCCGIPIGDIPKLITQQKEFIEYLENMLDNENDIFSVVRVKDVLSKYKEIIGGKDESSNKKSE